MPPSKLRLFPPRLPAGGYVTAPASGSLLRRRVAHFYVGTYKPTSSILKMTTESTDG
jgi:hypothetical protein